MNTKDLAPLRSVNTSCVSEALRSNFDFQNKHRVGAFAFLVTCKQETKSLLLKGKGQPNATQLSSKCSITMYCPRSLGNSTFKASIAFKASSYVAH